MKAGEAEMLRAALLIDGSNFYATCKNLQIQVDYDKLRTLFNSAEIQVVHAKYYTALTDPSINNHLRKVVDWLSYNGYVVETKEAREQIQHDGCKVMKGNMDVEIACDAISLSNRMDVIILVSGDGDFSYMGKKVQQNGAKFIVLSSIKCSMVSAQLRRQADQFIELDDVRGAICR